MVKKIAYTLLLTVFCLGVYGQSKNSDNDDYVTEGDEYVVPFDSLKTKDRMHYGFAMGAGFGQSSTFGNYFSTYYRPIVSYDVSPRLSVIGGITYVNSSVDKMPLLTDYSYQLFSGNISQYEAFVGARYKLTDKLSVGGSVFYDFTSYNLADGTSLGTGSGLNNLGYSANFMYKVNESFSIQGEIRVNDKNPYNQYPTFFSGFESQFIDGFMGTDNRFRRRW